MNGIEVVGRQLYGDGSLIKPFQSLEKLWFENMVEWKEWHILGGGEFSCLEELYVINCPKLTGDLPNRVSSLRRLEISGCQKLVGSLPDGRMTLLPNQVGLVQHLSLLQKLEISNMPNLKDFPPELCRLMNLEGLVIGKCPSLVSFPDMGLPATLQRLRIFECDALQSVARIPTALVTLDIYHCRRLEFPLPEEMGCYSNLETLLTRDSCDSLKSLPLGLFPKLVSLWIKGCTSLESLSIPNGFHLTSLHTLEISDCHNLVSFPEGGLPAPSLTLFNLIGCKKLKSLPEQMHTLLPSLSELRILDCAEVESFPEGGLPSNLHDLDIGNCPKLMARRMEWGLQTLSSLTQLSIADDMLESFPEEHLLPTTLTFLLLWSLPNLKSLNHHNGLQQLTSLFIDNCPKLQFSPGEELPASLSQLTIINCPLLKQRCQRDAGEDWPNIAHIPFIEIDDQVICQ